MKILFLKIIGMVCVFIVLCGSHLIRENSDGIISGKYSISLSVADVAASKAFYSKLGFDPIPGAGSLDQKWILMSNGETKIGLFQGLFPKNTLTFNPNNVRNIHQQIINQNIPITFAQGIENKEGPCSIMIADPDGNPILFDQH